MGDSPTSCPLFSSGATTVASTVGLLKGRDGDRMSIGSAKHPGTKYHNRSLEYESEECFYRHVLDSDLLRLLVQKGSVEAFVSAPAVHKGSSRDNPCEK